MAQPQPITITAAATVANGGKAPKPFVAVGGLPAASTTVRGGVQKAATVANVTPAADGTAVGTAFNILLTNLRAAGIIV